MKKKRIYLIGMIAALMLAVTVVLTGCGAKQDIDRNVVRNVREDREPKEPWKAAEGFTVWDEKEKKEKDIPLDYCNPEYETEYVMVYSYLGIAPTIHILTPKGEMTYPIKNFWMDKEKEALYLLEEKETIQVRKIELSPEQLLHESVLLDRDEFETLLADTYGIIEPQQQEIFCNLQADLFCQEEDGSLFLGGRVSGIWQANDRKYEIVYEIDRESEAVSARGYLQDLEIEPLFQEFLLHNLTVENPLKEEIGLGKELGFFDDKIYLSKAGIFYKRFAVLENGKDGQQELLFRMVPENGEEDFIYIFAQEKGRLICRDILSTTSFAPSENQKKAQEYHVYEARWLDCAAFFEIPTQICGTYLRREEVFAAVKEGDLSVVSRKPFDPEWMMRRLEAAYGEGDSRRLAGCDIDGDGFDELLLLIQYDYEEYEQIAFILDYRNGGAVCTYLAGTDVTEWLILGEGDKLVHCSFRNNGRCYYYGFYECTLNAGGIQELDYAGKATEVCYVFELDSLGMGLWWWKGQQPEITQPGIYFTRVYRDDEIEGGRKKELVSEEAFRKTYTELTGEEEVWGSVLGVINLQYREVSDEAGKTY